MRIVEKVEMVGEIAEMERAVKRHYKNQDQLHNHLIICAIHEGTLEKKLLNRLNKIRETIDNFDGLSLSDLFLANQEQEIDKKVDVLVADIDKFYNENKEEYKKLYEKFIIKQFSEISYECDL